MIEGLFFELLQVAIGTRRELSYRPSASEWKELYTLSKKQALIAVAFAGVKELRNENEHLWNLPEMLYLQWLGLTAKVAQRNKEVSAACNELVAQYAHDGMSCCILKGQGNLEYYPEDLRECRTPGDIDVWVKPPSSLWPSVAIGDMAPLTSAGAYQAPTSTSFAPCLGGERGIPIAVADLDGKGAHYEYYTGNEAVIEYVKMLHRIAGTEPQEGVRYHHIDAPAINGIEVEAHFRPLFLDSPLRNWRLQRWFKENEQFGVHDFAVGSDKTKTLKTPEGNVSNEVSEIVCEHPSSASSSSTDSSAASVMPSGEKQEINRSGVIPVPTVSFNAVYQLCHIYRHLFDEGIGLRQLLDYYFVLRALHIEQGSLTDRTESMAQWAEGMGVAVKSNAEIMHTLGRFGMKKFAGAVMYVLQTVLDPPKSSLLREDFEDWQTRWPWMICEPNEKEGKFLLNEIMQAGNFGAFDQRIKRETPSIPLFRGKKVPQQLWHAIEKTKHNLRLLTHYPEEVLCEPFFRIYHYSWRKLSLWRY